MHGIMADSILSWLSYAGVLDDNVVTDVVILSDAVNPQTHGPEPDILLAGSVAPRPLAVIYSTHCPPNRPICYACCVTSVLLSFLWYDLLLVQARPR